METIFSAVAAPGVKAKAPGDDYALNDLLSV